MADEGTNYQAEYDELHKLLSDSRIMLELVEISPSLGRRETRVVHLVCEKIEETLHRLPIRSDEVPF